MNFVDCQIDVSQSDLEKGVANDCKRCPIARALLRQLPDLESVEVDTNALWFHFGCIGKTAIRTPPGLAEKINEIDDDKPVKPFSFRLVIA